ncbi:hypothetical protein BX070DRAFT_226710 [Coemansia spiralis]|nr:hypothetical protein BX070DRAFT_226710 [Coemansia spiralis]
MIPARSPLGLLARSRKRTKVQKDFILSNSLWTCPKCSESMKDESDYLEHLTKCISV